MSKKKNSKKKIAIVIATVLLAITTLFLCFIYVSSKNYAKQTAEPIEAALIKAGAVKQCESGDTGRGPDNQPPYYRQYYDVKADVAEAIELIKQAAEANGYELTHASSTNRGFLDAVGDAYIGKWYFDDTSKQNHTESLWTAKLKWRS